MPTTPSPWRCGSRCSTCRGSPRPTCRLLGLESGPELVEALGEHAHPVSNLVWADRHGSIGYKTVGRLPIRRGRLPGPAQARLDRRARVGWLGPVRGAARGASTRIAASWSRPTTGSRPRTIPHHITSDYLDGYRARRIEELIEAAARARPRRASRRCRPTCSRFPGWRRPRRLARLRPRDQRERAAIERLRSWDGRMSPDSIAATIYQAFTLRLGREVTRAAIGDRDLSERWLDRADNGFVAHVTSPVALAVPPARPMGGGRRGAGRPALGGARPRRAARRPRRPRVDGSVPTPTDGVGARSTRWSSRTPLGAAPTAARPDFNRRLEVGGGQETVAQVGWDPNDPFTAIWAPCWRMVADPLRPERSRWQAFTGQSGPGGKPPLRRPAGGLAGGPDPADGGRGPLADARAAARWRRPTRERRSRSEQRRAEIQLIAGRAARAARLGAGRRRLVAGPARLAALDAALVRASRRRDLDLHLREVAEGHATSSATRGPRC